MARLGLLLAAAALAAVAAEDPVAARQGKRTLVLSADQSVEETHGLFLGDLRRRGHDVTIRVASNESVVVERYGEWLFDNLVVLAPKATEFGALDVPGVMRFLQQGGNVLVAGGPVMSDAVRELATECGVDFDPKGYRVLDHFAHVEAGVNAATLAKRPQLAASRVLTSARHPAPFVSGGAGGAPVVYEGVGASINPDNILAIRALAGGPTAYSADPSAAVKDFPAGTGGDVVLVAAVQARNNARAVFTGSLWMLSDEAFTARVPTAAAAGTSESGNRAFSRAISRWTFQEAGVLRAHSVRHAHGDGSPAEHQVQDPARPDLPKSTFPSPEIARNSLVYRVKDTVRYEVTVEVFEGPTGEGGAAEGRWLPYSPPAGDALQLEFVMLDPYYRLSLAPVAGAPGTFGTSFAVPDTYGIYTFRLHYRRPGLSVVSLADQVSVRPYRHNEYERFIPAAYPYYAAAFASMAAVAVFAVAFLHAAGNEGKLKAS